ncbi:MAG TPA: hypothetical protein VNT99_08235 [Methylomirabilota bacterium]|nr:hypothetical protein [Methylomirabilota bacterium]
MDAAAWFTAAVPDQPPTILRIRLSTYTLGHELLLARHASAFSIGGTITLGELLLAVLICSQPTFREARQLPATLDSRLSTPFLKLWAWRNRRADLRAASAQFMAYLTAGRWMPEVNIPTNSRELPSPWPLRSLALLMHHFHLSENEALDMPLSQANALLCALFDTKGEIDLYSEGNSSMFKHRDELDRRAAAGEDAWAC